MIEFTVSEDNRLVGMSLAAIYKKFQIKILVCAVEHEGKVFIPDGEYVLQAGINFILPVRMRRWKRFSKCMENVSFRQRSRKFLFAEEAGWPIIWRRDFVRSECM